MEIIGTKTFDTAEDLIGQATKVLQEAAELYEAAKKYERQHGGIFGDAYHDAMIDEAADVIQAVLNLYHKRGLEKAEVIEAMDRCLRRNEKRGRVK